MKNTKSILVVMFVLLTAQIASAYYCPSTGRWLSRDPIGEPGFETSQMVAQTPEVTSDRWINRDSAGEPSILQKKRRIAQAQMLIKLMSTKHIKFLAGDVPKVDSFLENDITDSSAEAGQDSNHYLFVNNDALDKCDQFGLISYAPGTCSVIKKHKNNMCSWQCSCPAGYTLGFGNYRDYGPCDRTPTRTCYKLDCWDYTKQAVCVVVVVGVIILSDGTAVPIYACAAAL